MLLADGGGGLPSVSGDSFTVKILPVTAGDVSGYTAQEIMQLFQGLDPESVAQAGSAHTSAASKLADLANAVAGHVSRLQTTWSGQAAQSAVDAFSKLHGSAAQLAAAAQQTGTVLTTLGTQVLPEYKSWTTTVPSGNVGSSAAAKTAAAQLQTQANFAAQQKLAELNDALVSANAALPSTIKISLPKLSGSAGTASLPGISGGSAVGGTGGTLPVSSTGGGGGRHAAPPSGPSPTLPSPTPQPTGQKPAPITLSQAPPPGSSTLPPTSTGGGAPSAVGTGSGPGTGTGSFFPGAPTNPSTSTSGITGPSSTGTPGQDDQIPPVDEVSPVGSDVPGLPGSFLPGSPGGGIGPMGGLPPGDEPASQSGLGNPGLGDPGLGDGVVPPDGAFGVMPGDTAVVGPDGMIGVPGSPMGGFGAFPGESVAGEPAVGGFAGGDATGPFVGGGVADGNAAADGVTGADGVGGGYGGFPMGGGAGGNNNEKDRYRESWMNEDKDLWNGGVPMVPSLLGR